MKRLQRSLTEAKSSLQCCYGRGNVVTVDVGRMLTAHVSNVFRCGSPWSCALCAPVVRQRRAMEIDAGLRRHLDGGGGALFVTLTLRHHRGDTLASRLDVITSSLGLVLKGTPWERRKSALGYVGAIKAVEITFGLANGWHPHSHSVLLFERPLSDDERADLRAWLHARWNGIAEKRSLGTVTRRNGVDVRAITTQAGIGEYVSSLDSLWSPGLELSRSDLKRRAPFDLLREVLITGDRTNAARWIEYEQATFGKRAIVWSPGLRALLLGVEVEATDEELAASEGLDLGLIRALVPTDTWNRTMREANTGRLLSDIERCAAALLLIADVLGHDVPPLDVPAEQGALHG